MFKRFAIIITCVVLLATTGGVFATWQYAENSPTPQQHNVGVSLSEFYYPPEEILPGGGGSASGEVALGENHFAVIEIIVNTAGNGYALNSNNSLIHSKLDNEGDMLFSNQKISGGNLKFILDPKNNTHKLYYVIEKSSDTLYYIYTFSTDALATASGTEFEIEVYRTAVEKSNKWVATVSHKGVAKTLRLSDIDVSADSQSQKYSINIETWHT